jgi:hypothetical protein
MCKSNSQQNNNSVVLQSGGTLLIFVKLDSTFLSYSLIFLFVAAGKYNVNLLGKRFFLDSLEDLVYYLYIYLFIYLFILLKLFVPD